MNEPETKLLLTIPTTDVAEFIRNLADQHDIRPSVTAADQWAATITRLSDDEVTSGPVQDTLVALKRAGLISGYEMAALLVNFLREEGRAC
ncbi:hypothetical protein [Stenotrophomonas bentonitica]|uniref:hypothetical protein n=1 Tax=Stenotrophomonas bentonitica TaxID=1450134 RepID=UPI00345E2BA3